MLLTWLSMAGAAEIDLARSSRALAEGRPDAAFAHAMTALDDNADMEAWLTWLMACEAVGLGEACRSEASMLGDQQRITEVAKSWHDLQVERVERKDLKKVLPELTDLEAGLWEGASVPRLVSAHLDRLVKSDPDAAAEKALEIIGDMPSHPEVVVPLFADGLPARTSLGKAKKKLVKTGAKAIKKASTEELYRWHEVFVVTNADEFATITADKLVEAGEPRPLDRLPWTRAQTVQAAKALMPEETPAVYPDVVPAEREAVALRLAEMLGGAGRHDESATKLATAREKLDSVSLTIAHAEALLNAGQLEEARDVAEQALTMSAEPWPTDLAASDRLGRRQGIAKSLALRGRVALAGNDFADAAVDLMVANQLALQHMATGDLEKAMNKGRYGLEEVKARLETNESGASEVALASAREALEAGESATVRASAADAISVLCIPTHRGARLTAKMAFTPELASAFALRAAAASDDKKSALVDVTTAILLVPWDAPADWWALKADLHTELGQTQAAFFARAMASSEAGETPPAWRGSDAAGAAASGAMVSTWMRGHEEIEPVAERLQLEAGRVIAFRAPGSGGEGSRPVLNRQFPSWSASDSQGTVSHQKGRIEILTFFRTDSPNSLRLLDEVTEMARRLRKERGVNVVLIGISMDPEESALDSVKARSEKWGTTKWSPDLGKRLGVSAFPTTWIVDSEGVARFQHVGYLGWSDYEAEIRFIAGI